MNLELGFLPSDPKRIASSTVNMFVTVPDSKKFHVQTRFKHLFLFIFTLQLAIQNFGAVLGAGK